ncbi:MAG: hypothetical protein LBC53_03565 [Spirochaetaceae bacterium]|jgi:ABC-type glycerol-3-phosphate transport system substrate-binding protein|nr:hypothetical protein [Spirochaetaceae bacterium]
MKKILFTLFLTHIFFISCSSSSSVLVLWTEAPVFAYYAQLFNASQTKYKIEVHEKKNLVKELLNNGKNKKDAPDIAVGKWLKSASVSHLWRETGFLFKKNDIQEEIFYKSLLDFGKIAKKQIFLPLSFNIGAIAFLPEELKKAAEQNENSVLERNVFISIDEMKKYASLFNAQKGAAFRRGFSPTWNWNGGFLYSAAGIYGASFEEKDSVISWNDAVLEEAITGFKSWVNENGGSGAEDDFIFKYSHEPPDRLIDKGRILFIYIKSNDLFNLSLEELNRLDYRWLSHKTDDGEKIQILEDVVLLGVTKKCKKEDAFLAFIKWFYSEYTQEELLEENRKAHISESVFAISGGFSSMRSVNEFILPKFYPALLTHLPPDDYLLKPKTFSSNWPDVKERVITPYIRERVKTEGEPARPLDQRLAEWTRINSGQAKK